MSGAFPVNATTACNDGLLCITMQTCLRLEEMQYRVWAESIDVQIGIAYCRQYAGQHLGVRTRRVRTRTMAKGLDQESN